MLRRYEIGDLALAAFPRPVTFVNPANGVGEPLRKAQFDKELAYVRTADGKLGQPDRVRWTWRGGRDPLPCRRRTSMIRATRRALIASTAALAGAPALAAVPRRDDAWKEADAILARIKPPAIPRRDFPITRFGARPGGEADCTEAIADALAAAAKAGGGRVVVPAGVWLTGAVHLKSRTELRGQGRDPEVLARSAAYLPNVLTRHEGVELMNYSPFIYALDQHDIALTGEGTLDGQADADHWWNWVKRPPPGVVSDRKRLADMGEAGAPVDQEGVRHRPHHPHHVHPALSPDPCSASRKACRGSPCRARDRSYSSARSKCFGTWRRSTP